MVRFNLSLDGNLRNCEKTTTFVKEPEKIIEARKESSIWSINKELYLKNPKSPTRLKKCIKNGTGKNHKNVKKVPKT